MQPWLTPLIELFRTWGSVRGSKKVRFFLVRFGSKVVRCRRISFEPFSNRAFFKKHFRSKNLAFSKKISILRSFEEENYLFDEKFSFFWESLWIKNRAFKMKNIAYKKFSILHEKISQKQPGSVRFGSKVRFEQKFKVRFEVRFESGSAS